MKMYIDNIIIIIQDDYKSAIENYNIAMQYPLGKDELREIYKYLGYCYSKRVYLFIYIIRINMMML